MTTEFYRAYLKSAKWKKKREQVFAYYGKRCYACKKPARILHVHHLTYDRLGRELMTDLIPLCVPCHKEITRISKSGRGRQMGLRRATMEFVRFRRASR